MKSISRARYQSAFIIFVILMTMLLFPITVINAQIVPTFDITRDGTTDTYHAIASTSSSSYTGSLKFVVESATIELEGLGGGNIFFAAGDFDLGGDWFEFHDTVDVTFAGQGIDVTIIRNNTSASTDTEPFDCSNCDRITVRDMTVSAGGDLRTTSDALDFDGGEDVLVERVKVTSSRGRGIVFDGKDTGRPSQDNIVRDCIVMDVPLDGIHLLSSDSNRIENCQIIDVGQYGIYMVRASASADNPFKPSDDNIIIGNHVENSGRDGIRVNGSNRNVISGNTVLNSSNIVTNEDGILIFASPTTLACDDNVVEFNTATDNQVVKTQRYGLGILHASCNRTVVNQNDFSGNLVGEILDNGTATIYIEPEDNEPPTIPTNPNATIGASVTLNWNPSTDNIGVAGYTVYRGGNAIGTTSAGVLTFTDYMVDLEQSYTYTIDAFDAAGNHSAESSAVFVTLPSFGTLTLPVLGDAYVNSASPGTNFGISSLLRVDQAPDVLNSYLNIDVPHLGGNVIDANLRVFANTNGNSGYILHATTGGWDESTITFGNAPSVGAILGNPGPFVGGTWTTVDVTSQIINSGDFNFVMAGNSPTAATFSSREGANPPELVINLVAPSQDITPPTAPGALTAIDIQANSVTLGWQASTDNVGVTAYDIYRDVNPIPIASVGGGTLTYQDTTVASGVSYQYYVVARDAAGNESPDSNTLDVTTLDNIPPTTPTNPNANVNASVTLNWNPSTDNIAVTGYTIYRDTVAIGTTPSGVLTFTDYMVDLEQSYTYTIDAFDAADNHSPLSIAVPVTLPTLGTLTLPVLGDAYVNISSTSTNFGGSSLLRLDLTPIQNSYLYFNVPHLGGNVIDASLRVFANTTGNNGYDLHTTGGGWDESTITFDNAPPVGANIGNSGAFVGGTWTTLDVTSQIVSSGDFNFVMVGVNNTATTFSSREGANPPELVINLVGNSVDVTPPTAPGALTAIDIQMNSVTLGWQASTDNVGVTAYDIYRDANPTPIASVGSGTLTYQDTTVVPATLYVYTVIARDAAGNESDPSTINVTTLAPDTTPPSAPGALIATDIQSNSVTLGWQASTDNVGVIAYDIYRAPNPNPIASVSEITLSYQDTTVAPSTPYVYSVIARDAAGNSSDPSLLNVTTLDAPLELIFTPSDDATIRLNNPTQNYGSAPDLEIDAQSTKDMLLRFDVSGVSTATVGSATLRIFNTNSSHIGGNFFATTNTNWSESTVTWNTAPAGDGGLLGSLGSVTPGIWYEVDVTSLVTGDGPVSLRVSSTHANGADYSSKENIDGNAPQLVISLTGPPTPDTTPPTAPGSLTAIDIQGNSVTLGWQASTDNIGVTAYDIYRDANPIPIASVGGGTLTYQDLTVVPNTSYEYSVIARDAAGNESLPSDPINVTTLAPDTTPPTAPGGLTAIDTQTTSVTLGWQASTDNVGVIAYDIYRAPDTNPIASVGGATLSYQDTTVVPDTSYDYSVIARDAAGNPSDPSNLNVTTLPSPVELVFIPSDDATIRLNNPTQNYGSAPDLEIDAQSAKDMLLRFDVSGIGTAPVGSAILRIFNTNSSHIGGNFFATTNTNWNEGTVTWNTAPAGDGGLLGSLASVTPGIWYEVDVTSLVTGDGPVSLRVSSTHANGADYSSKEHTNGNAPQLVISLTGPSTPDTTPPTAPGSLTAIDIQGNSVTLGWQASLDNVGVIAYDIYRDSAPIASVSGITLSYQDITVLPNTNYDYTVIARDAAGNESDPSNLNVTTLTPDTTPPTAPGALTAIDTQSTSVTLGWQASTDNVGVIAYDIYRNANPIPIASVGAGTLSYQDTALLPNTSYDYTVIARDAAGNPSDPSNLNVTTLEPPLVSIFTPSDDATIRLSNPTQNYGSSGNLEVDAMSTKDTLLRFNVTGLGSAVIESATLRMFNTDGSHIGGDFFATTNTNWSEGTVTWDTAPLGDGGLLGSLASVTPGIWYEVDVTSLVTGDGVVSIRVSSTHANGADYSSKENIDGNGPQLVIQLQSGTLLASLNEQPAVSGLVEDETTTTKVRSTLAPTAIIEILPTDEPSVTIIEQPEIVPTSESATLDISPEPEVEITEEPTLVPPTIAPTDVPPATDTPLPPPTEEPPATSTPLPPPTDVPPVTSTPLPAPTEEPPATSTPLPAPTEEPPATSTPLPAPTDVPPATDTPLPPPTDVPTDEAP